ncbi:MAG: hypothetical protein RLZZ267_191 [Bacillota bacterium]
MNRWLKLLCLITLLGILAGCWDYSPIERAFLVEGISIDESKRDPEKLEISIIDVDFKRKKRALSAEGRTISEALDRIQDQTSKIVVLSHVKIILISETIAQKSVLPYFDVFVRNMQISNEASFVIVKGRALSLFNPKNLTYSISGRTYSQMIQSSETKFDDTLYKLHNITVEMMYRNNNFTLPVLKLNKKKKVASFNGIALIKSGKMIDTLSMDEAKLFLILRRATNRMAYTIKMNNRHTITYRLYEKSSSVSCKYRNGKWHLTFRAAFNREVVESNVWKTRPMTSAERAQFEQKVTKKLEREGKKLLTKLQKEAGFDPLWVSECARMNKPNHFQSSEWDEYFTNADTNVQIQVHLHRFGQLF